MWLTAPPFDHTKLMVVDGRWSMIGSANWDDRSLRLNFELAVESFDSAFSHTLWAEVRRMLARATRSWRWLIVSSSCSTGRGAMSRRLPLSLPKLNGWKALPLR